MSCGTNGVVILQSFGESTKTRCRQPKLLPGFSSHRRSQPPVALGRFDISPQAGVVRIVLCSRWRTRIMKGSNEQVTHNHVVSGVIQCSLIIYCSWIAQRNIFDREHCERLFLGLARIVLMRGSSDQNTTLGGLLILHPATECTWYTCTLFRNMFVRKTHPTQRSRKGSRGT